VIRRPPGEAGVGRVSENKLIPKLSELQDGAADLIKTHFEALNNGDETAFKHTAYLFPENDGKPFNRWWEGMRSLVPYRIEIENIEINNEVSPKPVPHLAIWVKVIAKISNCTRNDSFVVWYLVDSGEFKLGCRLHWWLE